MKRLFLVFAAVCMLGAKDKCGNKIPDGARIPEDTRSPTAKEYEAILLFEHDGCKLYRFYDGQWIYWSKCGDKTETAWVQHCGDNCTRPMNVRSK